MEQHIDCTGKTVSIIGLGYIGLPTAVVLARHGVHVIGVDVTDSVVAGVNAGKAHIAEPDLGDSLSAAVREGSLRAVSTPEAADVFIIAVPTPFMEGHKPDTRYIHAAAISIAPVLKRGDLVILESTSPVGTTERMSACLADARQDLSFPHQAGEDADVQIAYCPERVLPGKIVQELTENDRIVGGMSHKAAHMATAVYRLFVHGNIAETDARTAELCKLTENSFRDVNIAFANELSMICDQQGINVRELIALANRHPRVHILQPGCGVGGHCIAVDPWFIVDSAPKTAHLITAAREVNDIKPLWVVEKIEEYVQSLTAVQPEQAPQAPVTVACLGLSFKPDIDDLRESPALLIARELAGRGLRVLAVEPNISALPEKMAVDGLCLTDAAQALEKADVVCMLVNHRAFRPFAEQIRRHPHVLDFVDFAQQGRGAC